MNECLDKGPFSPPKPWNCPERCLHYGVRGGATEGAMAAGHGRLACAWLAMHLAASPCGTAPSLPGNTWFQHTVPAWRSLSPAPGLAMPRGGGTADGWPSGHTEGCPGRYPRIHPHCASSSSLPSGASGGSKAGGESLSPPQTSGSWLDTIECVGLHLASGPSMSPAVQRSG